MFTALIGCFRRDRSLVWFVEPDELFKSSVVEIQLEGGGGCRGRSGCLIVCFSTDDELFEWVLLINQSQKK